MSFAISKLIEYFEEFPGIGPRQAARFVYYLLTKDRAFLNKLAQLISNLPQNVTRCTSCQRFFELAQSEIEGNDGQNNKCQSCRSSNRDKSSLLVIEKDIDLDNIEKAGFYRGFYYVLGGLVPALGKDLPKEIRMKELFERVKKDASADVLKEIILALSATLEGDNTTRYIEKILEPILQKRSIKISRLGRGLSTGTELEYADSDTLKNAFEIRRGSPKGVGIKNRQ